MKIIKKQLPNSLTTLELLHEGRELRDAQLMLAVEGEKHFRDIALEKGINWDALARDEQIQFVRERLCEEEND